MKAINNTTETPDWAYATFDKIIEEGRYKPTYGPGDGLHYVHLRYQEVEDMFGLMGFSLGTLSLYPALALCYKLLDQIGLDKAQGALAEINATLPPEDRLGPKLYEQYEHYIEAPEVIPARETISGIKQMLPGVAEKLEAFCVEQGLV